jgi:hypothetical protein
VFLFSTLTGLAAIWTAEAQAQTAVAAPSPSAGNQKTTAAKTSPQGEVAVFLKYCFQLSDVAIRPFFQLLLLLAAMHWPSLLWPC